MVSAAVIGNNVDTFSNLNIGFRISRLRFSNCLVGHLGTGILVLYAMDSCATHLGSLYLKN